MEDVKCPNCRGRVFAERDGYRICRFCDAHYPTGKKKASSDDFAQTSIGKNIERLLEKCSQEPWNARKYANLILDLDPSNIEAHRILRSRKY